MGGRGQALGVGLRKLDETGVQIDRWRTVDNVSVEGAGVTEGQTFKIKNHPSQHEISSFGF